MKILLSIKPKYAEAIIAGKKKYEFRKAPFPKNISRVYVYSSNSHQKIIGYFTVERIITGHPNSLWKKFGREACIEKDEFDKYYRDKETAICIKIGSVHKFDEERDPYQMRPGFVAPQSFRYIEKDFAAELEKKSDKKIVITTVTSSAEKEDFVVNFSSVPTKRTGGC